MKNPHRLRVGRPSSKRARDLVRQHTSVPSAEGTGARPDTPVSSPSSALQEFYDLAPGAFFTLDKHGRITELNEKGAKLLGFPAQRLVGRAFVVFIAKQYIRAFLYLLTHSTRNPATWSINIDLVASNRIEPVQVSLTTSVTESGVIHRLVVVDVTDLRQTEQLLQQSLSNWYSLIHNAPDVIMTLDPDGNIALVNKPIWGYSVDTLSGTNILGYIPEAEHSKVLSCIEHAFQRRSRSICDICGVNEDWAHWYQLSFGPPHGMSVNADGLLKTTTTTITLVLREISEHKRKEETLRTSRAQMRDFAARVEEVLEEERTRVAREIHDDLGQALTALKLDLSWLHTKPRSPAETRKKLKALIAQVDDTIDRVRRIASELRPSVLDNLGLIPAIEWQAAQFRKRTRIRVKVSANADGSSLTPEASVAVFRVVQEALTNVIRHAKASRVNLEIFERRHALHISISDNGIGITRRQEKGLKSLGIVGMKERIARIGGDFNFVFEPGKGTRLEIKIPLPHD